VLIIAAVITGLVSVLSAFIAWRQTERVKRIETATQEHLALMSAQAQAAIESFKAEQERSKTAFEVAMSEAKPVEDALSHLWNLIQTFKELITLLADGVVPTTEESKRELWARLSAIREEFLDGFGGSGASLPKRAREAAHTSKNIMHEVSNIVTRLKGSSVSHKESSQLMALRKELTLYQESIASDRSELRLLQFQKYLDMLVPAGDQHAFSPALLHETRQVLEGSSPPQN
jgi:hypothetical protein